MLICKPSTWETWGFHEEGEDLKGYTEYKGLIRKGLIENVYGKDSCHI